MATVTNKRKVVRSTQAQIKLMVDYMSTNPLFAAREYTGPLGSQKIEAEWIKLKDLLTEKGPAKTIEQWKHTWRDLKKKARDEGARARYALGVTGNDAIVPKISEMSEKILGAIGRECAVGIGAEGESMIGGTVTWRDLKKKARDEGARARYALGVTGNDAIVPKISEMSEKILGAIGRECAVGIGAEGESMIGGTVTWRDLKKKARDEGARARYALGVTGNDAIVPKISEMSEKILGAIGRECAVGIGAEGESMIGGTVSYEDPGVAEQALDQPSTSAFIETDPPGPSSSTPRRLPAAPRRKRTRIPSREGPMAQYLSLMRKQTLLLEVNASATNRLLRQLLRKTSSSSFSKLNFN